MTNQLRELATNVIQANNKYESAWYERVDAANKLRKEMLAEKKYRIVRDGKLLRLGDGIIIVEDATSLDDD